MNLRLKTVAVFLSLAALPAAAQQQPPSPAPSALETFGAMRPTGSTAEWPEIPQTGAKADQVKENLTKIKLPPASRSRSMRWCRMHVTSRSDRRASRPSWAHANRKSGW